MQIPFFAKSKSSGEVKVKETGASSFLSLVTSYQQTLGATRKTYISEYKDWVYACISARAQDVAGGNYYALKNGERIDENKSELMKLLHTVNPNMTMRELFFGTQAHLDTDGNAFWFLAREKKGAASKGKIREIYLLRPDRVEIAISKDNPLAVKGYVYKTAQGGKITFEISEIIHFRNFNPQGEHPFPHRGKAVVEAGLSAIETDNQARRWNFNFFKNSARPDGFISKKEGIIDDAEYNRIRAELETKYQGADNAHKTMILAGGLEWKEVTRLQKDMEFIEQRRFSRDEILATFKVPKSVIGIVEDVNRANAEASDYIFASRTTRPLMQSFVDTVNEYIGEEMGETLGFASPVPEDKITKVTTYEKGVNKWLTVNEIRSAEGLPPVTGGDAIISPTGESFPVEKTQKKTLEEKIAEADEIEIDEEIVSKFLKGSEEIEIVEEEDIKEKVKSITEEQRKSFVNEWLKVFDINEKPLKTKMAQYFAEQEKEVIKNLQNSMKGLKPAEYHLKAFSDVLFDEEEQINLAISLITPRIAKYIKQSSANVVETLGFGSIIDIASPEVQKYIDKRASYFAESINTTTVDKILRELAAGSEAQESLESLTARVENIYGEAKTSRSEMIARTEVSASGNYGAMETYKAAGVEEVEWVNPDPEHEACIENAGKVRKIGDEFPSGDTEPPAHPNCRSVLIAVFND